MKTRTTALIAVGATLAVVAVVAGAFLIGRSSSGGSSQSSTPATQAVPLARQACDGVLRSLDQSNTPEDQALDVTAMSNAGGAAPRGTPGRPPRTWWRERGCTDSGTRE